ncbi:MAG: 2-succinyl-5-enolpyruvyl-6-hydroxy-3-cyclohexene-1-carboxylic-acid synthase [Cyanosarcina radialis HA8281-LM2]|jgi:2-succinyl-5-enolpyruvyl-6-hydroxy-3-cyclohexene-1-carboxylate synthase|nr:2-succinyl-5-enolpyruvyl-6-hydroxy-3-cyclohexene-1-carboxylic-acid synthase [Cyanosarcina radialis HA8281-LM2]
MFANTNSVWAFILVETLKRLGLTTAVICPGSRSTPLAVAFAGLDGVEAISVLDERSAAFFALGIAKHSGLPVVLVCTSGTAGANFYPAIIEARESRVPLLVLSADRPPELRECHSGQTIDQVKLYGNYPNWQTELAVPSLEMSQLRYLRQMVMYAWERSLFPVPGVVHLNIPFRDPLAPIPDGSDSESLASQFRSEEFFNNCSPSLPISPSPHLPSLPDWQPGDTLQSNTLRERGIIIAGIAQPQSPKEYVQAIAHLAETYKFPVLAEGLSPVRNYADLNPYLISTYDLILRNSQLAQELTPNIAIQVGELPTSKELRTWLEVTRPKRWVIDPSHHNFDPLHGNSTHLRLSVEQLAAAISSSRRSSATSLHSSPSRYLARWCQLEDKARRAIADIMTATDWLFEGKAAWLISQTLPSGTPVFIANSMPVRDVESFWTPNNFEIKTFFNRGANGIDGTLSTALGIAHRQQSSVMLTGDLALLHDTNGFLLKNKFVGHLTIILINNNGGGIFETLAISKFEPPFEEFFATPQDIDFDRLCATYNVEYELITVWSQLEKLLNPLPTTGIRVLELKTDRKLDAKWRRDNLSKLL